MEYSFLPGPERFLELTSAPEDPALQDRIRKVVAAELSRYPPGTLDSLLDAVLIGGELTVGGLRANGAYVFGTVFLTVDETDFGWATSERVVATLHHEISSILLRAHRAKFDEASFRNALPAKFTYEDDRIGLEDHQPLRAWEFDVSLGYLEVGFLKPWAMRNLEQDFNSYAEELFVRPPRLLRLFAAESLVAKKARIVRDFYCSIDPRFAPIFEGAGSPTLYEQAEEPSNAD